jgi:hypothetical protein
MTARTRASRRTTAAPVPAVCRGHPSQPPPRGHEAPDGQGAARPAYAPTEPP